MAANYQNVVLPGILTSIAKNLSQYIYLKEKIRVKIIVLSKFRDILFTCICNSGKLRDDFPKLQRYL